MDDRKACHNRVTEPLPVALRQDLTGVHDSPHAGFLLSVEPTATATTVPCTTRSKPTLAKGHQGVRKLRVPVGPVPVVAVVGVPVGGRRVGNHCKRRGGRHKVSSGREAHVLRFCDHEGQGMTHMRL